MAAERIASRNAARISTKYRDLANRTSAGIAPKVILLHAASQPRQLQVWLIPRDQRRLSGARKRSRCGGMIWFEDVLFCVTRMCENAKRAGMKHRVPHDHLRLNRLTV